MHFMHFYAMHFMHFYAMHALQLYAMQSIWFADVIGAFWQF